MSWSTFTTDAVQIKQREAELFGDYSDSDAIAVMQTVAKDQMYRDLLDAGITDVDACVTEHAADLKRALAYLQLYLYFVGNHTGLGSANDAKANHYRAMYREEVTRFTTFRTGASQTSKVVTQWR